MSHDAYLLVFAISFMGCVLSTPAVTKFAGFLGAIDRPDQSRRIHKGEIPRLGGLGLAFGISLSLLPLAWSSDLISWPGQAAWVRQLPSLGIAAAIILVIGMIDDTRGISARVKLLGQALAVLALYLGGVQISQVEIMGMHFEFSHPYVLDLAGRSLTIDPLPFIVTMIWFLGCMNVWNLIDGMDGLASGVGLLVTGTLLLVAFSLENYGPALLAAALAGGLAGFLLYNWHPACIFLGDTGSLLIGLLLGLIGIHGSMKQATTVSILLPILAMGLPISDTAMAIFRRWVRHLPLSAADRRHVHHLLINLGLNPRQAALLLYCFTAFLCGVVLLGIVAQSESLALFLAFSGCLAFLLVLYSRRDELRTLRNDFASRMKRGGQERKAAKIAWETIQRIELSKDPEAILSLVEGAAKDLGCDAYSINCFRQGKPILRRAEGPDLDSSSENSLTGPTATFRISGGADLVLAVSLHQAESSPLEADIVFRFLQRLTLSTAERLGFLLNNPEDSSSPPDELPEELPVTLSDSQEVVAPVALVRPSTSLVGLGAGTMGQSFLSWVKSSLGFGPSLPGEPRSS